MNRMRIAARTLSFGFCAIASLAIAQATSPPTITINYHRDDNNYATPTLWTWDARNEKQPKDQEVSTAEKTPFGVKFVLNRSLYGNDDSDAEKIGFIPRLNKDWNQKDGTDRTWVPSLGNEIWIVSNDPKIYSKAPNIAPRVLGAFLDDAQSIRIKLSTTIPISEIEKAAFGVRNPANQNVVIASIGPSQSAGGATNDISVTTAEPLDPAAGRYVVTSPQFGDTFVTPRAILNNPEFYGTTQELGAIYTTESTTFRTFSPSAESISVLLLGEAKGLNGKTELPMKSMGKGVWEVSKEGNLEGKFYRLRVRTPQLGEQIINDPWATNTTGDEGNARITDLRADDPSGFRPIARPFTQEPASAIIYQVHVRDFTSLASSGVDVARRGKFLGMIQNTTLLPGTPDIKTGIDHLKELGVTHVQIQPLEDFDNNEARPEYSWGYMTAFFNSPDGSFASDYTTDARIKEFKQVVKALKDNGIAVVMDVVYNHTGTQNTFEQLAPGYFHRMRDDGSFWNGSGTGNEFKSESPMGRKFIIDSCKFWVEEYGIDGFRFDLMGLIDKQTMLDLRAELTKISPSILLYGEPWAATGPADTGIGKILYKDEVKGTGLGAFNDSFRDALKGSTEGDDGGYIQSGANRTNVIHGIAGSVDDWAASPSEVVNYVSVHDNLDLWDKILASSPKASEEEHVKMVMLAGAILSTSQGAMLLHAGTDFCRYKQGVKNSYNAGDDVNGIDWNRKKTYAQVNLYYRGLIALRKAHPVFALNSADEIHKRLKFENANPSVPNAIVFTVDGTGLTNEPWKMVCVFINPNPAPAQFTVPGKGDWKIYVQGNGAGLSPTGDVETESIVVEGRSVTVIAR